jgi:protein gp37
MGKISLRGIDWVIVGGESGPGARSMEASWVLMAAGEGSILAGPVGTIALMFNGGEGSSQS